MYRTKTYIVFIVTLTVSFMIGMCHVHADQIGKAYREAEKLSSNEKIAQASKSVAQMQGTLKFALKSLKVAYQNKQDFTQVNCIRDKLSTIKGLLRISEEAEVSLREAMITAQSSLIDHEFVKISMARQRVKLSRTQIEGCIANSNNSVNLQQNQKSKAEILDESVQKFVPNSEERNVIIYDVISSERPEAITASE